MPLGTGNDFAQCLGWKEVHFTGKLSQLRKISVLLCESQAGYYDIWEANIECEPEGKITEIKNGKEVPHEEKKLVRNFTNYFGIGTDAKICYIAQKLNAKGVYWKKIAYGFAGFLTFWISWSNLAKRISIKQQKASITSTEEPVFKEKDPETTIEHVNLDEEYF